MEVSAQNQDMIMLHLKIPTVQMVSLLLLYLPLLINLVAERNR